MSGESPLRAESAPHTVPTQERVRRGSVSSIRLCCLLALHCSWRQVAAAVPCALEVQRRRLSLPLSRTPPRELSETPKTLPSQWKV
eukprot:COSAG02_NODE_22_length_53020_cov_16.223125_23_plen_86_part_00